MPMEINFIKQFLKNQMIISFYTSIKGKKNFNEVLFITVHCT